MYEVVDLGCKNGNAIQFLLGQCDIPGFKVPSPENCLGIDSNEKYRASIEGCGYKFMQKELGGGSSLPESFAYLGHHFLEHTHSVETAKAILYEMIKKAEIFVWIRIPSFEQNGIDGEGALIRHGLRFAWTEWLGHKANILVADIEQVIAEFQELEVEYKQLKLITSSSHDEVVPIDAPVDTIKYEPHLGPKKRLNFVNPVVGEHEFKIWKRR